MGWGPHLDSMVSCTAFSLDIFARTKCSAVNTCTQCMPRLSIHHPNFARQAIAMWNTHINKCSSRLLASCCQGGMWDGEAPAPRCR